MAFVKREIKDRVVQYPRRYQLVEVQPGIFDLIPVTGTVTEEGTPVNKELLQRYEDGLDAALEKTGDGKDVTVTFTEAATEAHIASGEKLSVMFGKILKMFKGKAPNSHASSGTTYGIGTTANYGHVKTINGLTQASHVDGTALSAYQGKVLDEKIDNLIKIVFSETSIISMPNNTSKTFTVSLGTVPTKMIRFDCKGAVSSSGLDLPDDYRYINNLVIDVSTSQVYFPLAERVSYSTLSNVNKSIIKVTSSGKDYSLVIDKITLSGSDMIVTIKSSGNLVATYNCSFQNLVEVI